MYQSRKGNKMTKVFAKLAANKTAIISTQVVIIAALVIAMQSVGVLANLINKTANNYATVEFPVNLTK